jgi:hypothetical protein
MKKFLLLISIQLASFCVLAGEPPKKIEPVKMSKTKICHTPNSSYYAKTQNFTPYKTLKECLDAGGRLPKR